ncbi:MAG: Crp/Fnr family transcriptional regulator [Flavobacteriales bacterium]|nr:Crp/Fnr family transcriptional regulator [Flavobacteriales bacterium]
MNSKDLKQLDKLIENYCTPEWRKLAWSNTSTIEVNAGELIFKEGEKAENIFMVKHGRVKVYSNYTPEMETIVRFAIDGQIIGHRGFGEDFTFSVSAVALSTTSVFVLPMSIFQNLLKANNLFCYYFMLFFTEELRRSERMHKNQLNMTVKQRVAQAIRMNMENFGFEPTDTSLLSFTLTRKDMASVASTTYESVIRSLAELQKEEIIKIEGKKLRILNKDKLCEMTHCSKDFSLES